jgi:hypothetical protein
MNALEALEKIKALFQEPEPAPTPEPEPEPTKFESYNLLDGTSIEISALEVGGSVNIMDANGDATPAPDAEYTLADGTEVSVAGGSITAIATKEDGPIDPAESEEMAQFKSQIANQSVEIEGLKAEIKTQSEQFNEAFKQLIEVVETIANAPSAEPSKQPQGFKHTEPIADKEERLLNKLKNLK